MKSLAVIILVGLLFVPAEARRKKRPKAKKGRVERVRVAREICPPCRWSYPDRVEAIRKEDQEADDARISAAWQAGMYGQAQFKAEFDQWIRAQPKLRASVQLTETVNAIARQWYQRGRTDATNAVLEKMKPPP